VNYLKKSLSTILTGRKQKIIQLKNEDKPKRFNMIGECPDASKIINERERIQSLNQEVLRKEHERAIKYEKKQVFNHQETPTIYLLSEELENGKLQGGFSQTRLNGQELLMEGDQVIQEIIYRELKLNLFKEEVLKKTMTISTQISIVFFGTQ